MPNCLNIFGRGRSVRRTLSVSTFYEGAEMSNGHFGTNAELSWVRNVQGPKCPYTGHELKLFKPPVCLNARKYFFTIRVLDACNSLPATIINCGTLDLFKNKIDRFFKGNWTFRSQDHSLPGTFAPWNFRSLELSLPGTFAPWDFRSLELSLPPTNVA